MRPSSPECTRSSPPLVTAYTVDVELDGALIACEGTIAAKEAWSFDARARGRRRAPGDA